MDNYFGKVHPCCSCRHYYECVEMYGCHSLQLCEYYEDIPDYESLDEDSEEYNWYLIDEGRRDYYDEWSEFDEYLQELH